ncbi:putative glycoside hydrolase [Indibacter alkaliphilus LW1]|uniref:Glycoside hydrolase n=1 Tax=Indibacter alkaliphilus (strain CCUG 57479 / KCTC 22604 / LW1) TaxID=1189612 RepID=S2DD35_INDAL|nr:family 10 glycosylhydrolase [Indibacter alkaliphilus]EOZ97057.1 putative glycoside hydrolase [Indibacter alkaliphilus LW1]
MNKFLSILYFAFIFLAFQSCKTTQPNISSSGNKSISTPFPTNSKGFPERTVNALPAPEFYKVLDMEITPSPREFRAVWIATVANIDWPSAGHIPFERQKREFTELLDYYQKLNFNAVIVQIRTSGDAFYPSKFAPWSRYLTGKEGQKPNTTEDPLSWMILEAHRRGLEFHAWLNPYRATMNLDTKILSPEHDFFKHKDWMIKYDTKYYYNPGLPEVRRHLVNIIQEVVKNYNIDAIHFDDYFYPYKVGKLDFADAASFKKYGKSGQKIDDWRRENVSLLVKEVNETIKAEKPWVQFGISPFGVWRNKDKDPNGSNTRAGQTNFDDLYADVITWMKNGWIDYLIPQLYWSMDYNLASHRELVNWWSRNSYNTKIYIGNGPYKIRDNADKAWENPMEIPNQVALSKITPNISGNAYFSAKSMYLKNRDVADLLFKNHYQTPVLTPDVLSVSFQPTFSKKIELVPHSDGFAFQLSQPLDPDFRYALIYTSPTIQDIQLKNGNTLVQKVYLDETNRQLIPVLSPSNQKFVIISFIDRYGKETKPKAFEIQTRNLTQK